MLQRFEIGLVLGAIIAILLCLAFVGMKSKARRRMMADFQKFLGPAVFNAIKEGPQHLGWIEKELTVYICDLAAPPSFPDGLSPNELILQLNEYLSISIKVILANGGTIVKFVGDGIICFWGALEQQHDHANRACRCALQQLAAMESINVKLPADRKMGVHVGISTGLCSVGNFGTEERLSYDIFGDAANLAHGLEGENRQRLNNILISQYTYARAKDWIVVRELGDLQIRGNVDPVKIYELVGVTDGLPGGEKKAI
jgi:adenylate cyclase